MTGEAGVEKYAMQLHVALAQMDIQLGNPAANMAMVHQLLPDAVARGADLLVLPELWSTGYDLERAGDLADAPGEGVYAHLAALAREHQIALAGSTLTRHTGRPTNRATVYGPDGHLLASYDKLHLFGLMDEDRYLAPGAGLTCFSAPWGMSALAICYDLRFPELFRAYAVQGAGVMIVPAEWPHPRLEHWRTLVQARAIENQCFVIAVNRVGRDAANSYCGHSLVVDPWGQVLVEAGETAELLTATLDLSLVTTVRSRMSVLRDRRPDIY